MAAGLAEATKMGTERWRAEVAPVAAPPQRPAMPPMRLPKPLMRDFYLHTPTRGRKDAEFCLHSDGLTSDAKRAGERKLARLAAHKLAQSAEDVSCAFGLLRDF